LFYLFLQKENQLQQDIENLEKLAETEGLGGLHHKQRVVKMLKKQIEQKQIIVDEKQAEIIELKKKEKNMQQKLAEVRVKNKNNKEQL
jgi:hypothetical protein